MNSKQTVSQEEYRRLDNRVTCILQQRWPANEINQWVGLLKGKQQAVTCAILRLRHPLPASLALPAITDEVQKPHQTRANHPTVQVFSTDGRHVGRRHILEGLGRPLFITSGSTTDRANPGAAEQLNPTFQPALHQVVINHQKKTT